MMKKKRKMRKTYQTMYNLMILEKKKYFGSGYPREGLAVIKNKRIVYFAIAFSTLLMNIFRDLKSLYVKNDYSF